MFQFVSFLVEYLEIINARICSIFRQMLKTMKLDDYRAVVR